LSIDAQTGLISGTIAGGAAASGPYQTTVTAKDGTSSASTTFTWQVSNPILVMNPGTQSSTEASTVSLPVLAVDSTSGATLS
jgi:hypothetical protein